jgi:hypothetical protein
MNKIEITFTVKAVLEVDFEPQDLSKEVIEETKKELDELIKDGYEDVDVKVTSFKYKFIKEEENE